MPPTVEARARPRLGRAGLKTGLKHLAAVDPDLASVLAAHGEPPLWDRDPGFPTLVRIILEQQVSLASARAAFDKLRAAVRRLAPETFLALDDGELLKVGFSRQKAGYCRGVAALERVGTAEARRRLLAIRGVGPWTADIYLLMALGRRDVWPAGDLALAKASRDVKSLTTTPGAEELEVLAEPWRPWRSVAARLLWHHYLETRRNGAS